MLFFYTQTSLKLVLSKIIKYSRDYCIVEFPEENECGETPMSIIPSIWLKNEDDYILCNWPKHFKSNLDLMKAVRLRLPVENGDLCKVNIKYKTSKFIFIIINNLIDTSIGI